MSTILKSIFLTLICINVFAQTSGSFSLGGGGVVINGTPYPYFVAPGVCLNTSGACAITGSLNPAVSAVNAPVGSIYLSTNGNLYVKQDNGSSTNWSVLALAAATFSSIGPIDGNTASSNGLSAVGSNLYAQSASATVPGMVNNTTQSFSGNKTFTGSIAASNFSGSSSGTNTGDVTLGTANGLSLVGQALSLQASDSTHTGALTSTDWSTFNSKQSTALTNSHIFVGNVSNIATDVAVTGDITISNSGVTDIGSGVIVNADVNAAAAIAGTKISPNFGSQNVATTGISTSSGVGINTTSLSANTNMDIVADTSAAGQIIQYSGYGASGLGFRTRRARGTSASPTAAQSGDAIGFFGGEGYGATGFKAGASTGSMRLIAAENFTDTANGTHLALFSTPTGSLTQAERMRVAASGRILIGSTTDDGTNALQVTGSSISSGINTAGSFKASSTAGSGFYEVVNQSSAPSTPTSAMRIYADNSNRLSWKGTNGFVRTLDGTANTADRVYTLPDATTTIVGTDATQTLTNKSIVATQLTGTLQAAQEPAHTGDVTNSAGSLAMTIPNGTVTYAKMQTFGAQKMIANNTGSSAAPTEFTFQDQVFATYSGTIAWTGTTPPSGATNHQFAWSQVGHMVTLTIFLKYAVAGTALTAVLMDLPAGVPTPAFPSGLGAANDKLYACTGFADASLTGTPPVTRFWIKEDSGATKQQINSAFASSNTLEAFVTCQYVSI